jgi:MFS family permease
MSPVTPFLPIIGRQLGISSSMVGWIYFALPFAGLVSRSGFGFVADRLHLRKLVLFLSMLAMSAAFFFVQFSPSLETEKLADFTVDCGSMTATPSGTLSCACTWAALNLKVRTETAGLLAVLHRLTMCEDGHFALFVSCVTISNPDLLPSRETGVNSGIRN